MSQLKTTPKIIILLSDHTSIVQSLATINENVNIADLLSEDIAKISAYLKTRKATLIPIIESACKKLEPYVDDKTEICSIITKYLPKEAERDIRKYCPSPYKRKYITEEKDTIPKTLLQEALRFMKDVLLDSADIISEIEDQLKGMHTAEEYKQLETYIIEKFGGLAELKERVEFWKDSSIELAKIKTIYDDRSKLDHFTKFMLRINAFYINKSEVAKLHGISSKWMKQGVENNKRLELLAKKIWDTDEKFAVIQDWFNEQVIRDKKGLNIISLTIYKKKHAKVLNPVGHYPT